MKNLAITFEAMVPVEDDFHERIDEEFNQVVVLASLLDIRMDIIDLLAKKCLTEKELEERKNIHLKDNENYLLISYGKNRKFALLIRWFNNSIPHEVMYFSEISTKEYGYIELDTNNMSERILKSLINIKENI